MKSTTFTLDCSLPTTTWQKNGNKYQYTFQISLLPAFAIEYITVHYGDLSEIFSPENLIANNNLSFEVDYNLDDLDCRVVLFYHGIREYRLLFPNITDQSLQDRLGEFYREAEIAFDSAAWLTFMLMCGALFEGILFYKYKPQKGFAKLINLAARNHFIDAQTQSEMNKIKDYRNLVHADNHVRPYVSRADAMDVRAALDRFLRKL